MNLVYKSKGVSKSVMTKKIVSIVVCLLLALVVFCVGSSKTKGKSETIVVGGAYHTVVRDNYRFSEDQQRGFAYISLMFGVMAVIDSAILAGYRVSWTEIYDDMVKANSMGKQVSCAVKDITQISEVRGQLVVSGGFGKALLITENPQQARKVLEGLTTSKSV